MSENPRKPVNSRFPSASFLELTGIPQEHDMPAPVTITIFLLFTTADERLDIARLVEESPASAKDILVNIALRTVRMLAYELQRRGGALGSCHRLAQPPSIAVSQLTNTNK